MNYVLFIAWLLGREDHVLLVYGKKFSASIVVKLRWKWWLN